MFFLEALDVWGDGGSRTYTFNLCFKEKFKKYYLEDHFWVMVPFPKIVINLPNSNEKLHHKGEPYRFNSQLVSSVQIESRHPVTFIWNRPILLVKTC